MKTRHLLFWRAGLIQALVETCVLGVLLTTGLLLVGERIPPNALDQAFLFLSSVCVLWCVLRLRYPERRWGARLLRERAAVLGLSLVLGGGLPALIFVVG